MARSARTPSHWLAKPAHPTTRARTDSTRLRQRQVMVLVIGWAVLVAARNARATPIVAKGVIGGARWKRNITIYIPRDPVAGRNRHKQLKEAVDAWKRVAADKHIGISITPVVLDGQGNIPGTGSKPDPKEPGTVTVSWVANKAGEATHTIAGEPTGRRDRDGEILRNAEYVTGKIEIDKSHTVGREQDEKKAKAEMLHEMGHMLGIDHSAETDSVMRKKLEEYIDRVKPGASDARELGAIYSAANARLDSSAERLPDGSFRYAYTANWIAGGEIPMVQLLDLAGPIQNPEIPVGWEFVDFPIAAFPAVVSFRVAPTDDLQAYLNMDNPTLEFAFVAPSPPGKTIGWAGTIHEGVTAPVPEPSSLVVLSMSFLVFFFYYGWSFWKCGSHANSKHAWR